MSDAEEATARERDDLEEVRYAAEQRIRSGVRLLLFIPLVAMMGPLAIIGYVPIAGTIAIVKIATGARRHRRASRQLRALAPPIARVVR